MFIKKAKGVTSDSLQEKRLAIDIGLHSIKFAYFNNNLLCLEEFPLFEQPKDLKGLKDQDLINVQMSVINRGLNMINPKAEIVLSPQPSLQVLTRILNRPPDMEIKGYLNKELPFEADQFSYDIQNIENGPAARKTKKASKKASKIAVSVADLDFIQRSIGLLGEFQLQIKKFTPHSVGLLNYLLMTSEGNEQKPFVFLDLGALYSHLIVYRQKGQFLSRTIEIGGNQFNQELVEKLNVDFETAERIKTERKLIDDSLFDSRGASTSMPMFQAINSILFGLVDEIKNSMTYFEDCFLEDLSEASILLAGGTSRLQNLDRFLEKELELPVKRVESAVHPLTPENQFMPQFASTVGLLGNASRNDLLDINLINNIEGLLFKLEDGDYYLTREGFVNKKKFKRKQKARSLKPSVLGRSVSSLGEPSLTPIAFIKGLPARVKALLKGEKVEMREMRVSFGGMDFSPIKTHLKTIFVVLGALFLVIYGTNRFLWVPKKKSLDRNLGAYVKVLGEVDRVRGALMSGEEDNTGTKTPIVAQVPRVEKIIWANKLKVIAAAIPDQAWISDLVLKESPSALVLSCHVYSYGKDHLKDIALFIENLKAQKAFMDDFKEVKFNAALRNKTDRDVYDFTLTFPLKGPMIRQTTETVERGSV